jgi:uncharacterized protein
MKLAVDRLEATRGAHAYEASVAWWHEQVVCSRELDYEVDGPFRFETEAYRVGDDVFLAGQLAGAIQAECSRCLQRYRHALSERFRLVLEPAGERQPADPEGVRALARDGMCLGDDLELGWYRGQEIDLDAFFTELISLALPLQPLCDEECGGLCPRCGVDRNQVACSCEEEERPPSPFAILATLRSGGGESEEVSPETSEKESGGEA